MSVTYLALSLSLSLSFAFPGGCSGSRLDFSSTSSSQAALIPDSMGAGGAASNGSHNDSTTEIRFSRRDLFGGAVSASLPEHYLVSRIGRRALIESVDARARKLICD